VAWHWCKSIGGSIIQLIILKIWVKWWDWLESVYLIQYLVTSIPVIIQRQSKNIKIYISIRHVSKKLEGMTLQLL
jgi:hypothetical protein